MLYLIAIFVPPLYFLLKKKWIAAFVTTAVFVVSLAMFIIIPVTWALCAFCAVWDLRKSLVREHAELVGQKVGEAIRREQAAGGR